MVQVRSMQQSDIARVAWIEQQCFSMPWSEQGFSDALYMDNTLFLVAEEEEKIIGYCGLYQALDEGEITNVAVHPDARNAGVGKQLMKALLQQGQDRKICHFLLEVRVSNEAAIHLYEQMGFSRQGIRRNFYERPREDAAVMLYDAAGAMENGQT